MLSSFEGHSLEAYPQAFDPWRERYNRERYNQERPHEALGNQVPASRYRVSIHGYPELLPAIEYKPGDLVRKVQQDGTISFRGHTITIGGAVRGHPIAVRPAKIDGVLDVIFVIIVCIVVIIGLRGAKKSVKTEWQTDTHKKMRCWVLCLERRIVIEV